MFVAERYAGADQHLATKSQNPSSFRTFSISYGASVAETKMCCSVNYFFFAAFAPSLPRAVRVFLGKCAIVLFRRAALAAFLMFRFAAVRCFLVVMSLREQVSRVKE